MASSKITPDHESIVTEIEIAAPPERVFRALIDREQALGWGGNDLFELTSWEMDPRPGGKWRFISNERKPSAEYSVSMARLSRLIRHACSSIPGSRTGTRNRLTQPLCAGTSLPLPPARE
jgi:Activator of Hsp90 ATPase homolog 1-like protein